MGVYLRAKFHNFQKEPLKSPPRLGLRRQCIVLQASQTSMS